MSHGTHPCPPAFPDAPPDPTGRPLRVDVDPATGNLTLERGEAVRLVLALAHLSNFAHWSPTARPYDEAIAHEAAWMAETLGDFARTGA